jgi:hypothetical protein
MQSADNLQANFVVEAIDPQVLGAAETLAKIYGYDRNGVERGVRSIYPVLVFLIGCGVSKESLKETLGALIDGAEILIGVAQSQADGVVKQ